MNPNFRAFLGFSLDGHKYSSSSHELLSRFHTLFTWSITDRLLACWSLCHACEFVLQILKVFLCVYELFSLYRHRSHSHTSCKHCLTSVIIVIRRHISIVALVALNCRVSLTKHMLSCWFEVSYHRLVLSVWSHFHVCMTALAFTLCQFLENLSIKQPSINQTWSQWPCTIAWNYVDLEVVLRAAFSTQF